MEGEIGLTEIAAMFWQGEKKIIFSKTKGAKSQINAYIERFS